MYIWATYKGYCGTLRFSDEDGLFIGKVLGIDDTVMYHGRTTDEAMQYFHSSVDSYIQMKGELRDEAEPDE